jgi:hypothetical protein
MAKKDLKPPSLLDTDRNVAIPKTVGEIDPSPAPPPVAKARSDFRVEEFTRLIRQKGYFCRWKKAMLCTCKSPQTDQARLGCTICDGSGFFYIDPIDVQAIITGIGKEHDIYKQPGEWISGDANITVEAQYRLGFRDSMEMCDSVMSFNEWIIKGERRGKRHALPANMDSARYKIVSVAALFYTDPTNDMPIRLEEGIHYEVTPEGWISWLFQGQKIPDATVLSIHYEFHPIWIITTHPNAVRDTVVLFKRVKQTVEALPLKCKAALDFIVNSNTSEIA